MRRRLTVRWLLTTGFAASSAVALHAQAPAGRGDSANRKPLPQTAGRTATVTVPVQAWQKGAPVGVNAGIRHA
jgi:hypothetical protein